MLIPIAGACQGEMLGRMPSAGKSQIVGIACSLIFASLAFRRLHLADLNHFRRQAPGTSPNQRISSISAISNALANTLSTSHSTTQET